MNLITRVIRLYEDRALRNVDFIFALSDYTMRSIGNRIRPDRSKVAFCGVDTDLYHPTTRSEEGYILSVGRFSDPRKNVGMLFRAYELLVRTNPSIPDLCLVGAPPGDSVKKWADDKGISSRIRYMGKLNGSELQSAYQKASCFVLSSDEEGLAIVILEAMSSGIPVVSTNSGGPESLVRQGETGYLTPTGDHVSLACAIARLIENKHLNKLMGSKGREVVLKKFSTQITGQVFLDVYDTFMKTNFR